MVLDTSGRIVFVNEAWRAFCRNNGGDSDTFYVGTDYLAVCQVTASDGSGAEARLIRDRFADLVRTGQPLRAEYPCDSPTERRWFELTGTRVTSNGTVYVVFQHRNVTTRVLDRLRLDEMRTDSELLAALVATSNDAILCYDLDGRIITWNRAAERMYGYTADEAIGRSLEILYPPNWPKRLSEYRDEIIAGELTHFEAVRVAKDGTERTVWVSCAPVRDPAGAIVSVSNIHRDVTEVRRAEQARDIIAHEVVHRAKNMLSVVNAILRQSGRNATTLAEFRDAVQGRIASLARSTDLLVSGNWSAVRLDQLLQTQLHGFGERSDALRWSGPEVLLQPEAVQVLGMALHELATNATKYGALASGSGQIELAWNVHPTTPDRRLEFSWNETGVVPSDLPGDVARHGFGKTVLGSLPRSMLDAEATHIVSSDRVEWRISFSEQHFSLAA